MFSSPDVVMSVVECEAVEMGVEGSRGRRYVGEVIALYPGLLDTVVCQGNLQPENLNVKRKGTP